MLRLKARLFKYNKNYVNVRFFLIHKHHTSAVLQVVICVT